MKRARHRRPQERKRMEARKKYKSYVRGKQERKEKYSLVYFSFLL
jgi:hypothetical protein